MKQHAMVMALLLSASASASASVLMLAAAGTRALSAVPGCQILQEAGILAQGDERQRYRLVLGECSEGIQLWLVDKGAASAPLTGARILDTQAFGVILKSQEVDLAGGNCAIGKAPLKQTVALKAHWRGRKEIRAGDGIEAVWRADMSVRKLVRVDVARMVCRQDEP